MTLKASCKRGAAAAFVLALAIVGSGATPVLAEGTLTVGIDRARIVKVNRPAAAIIVGNPLFTDAAIQNDKTIIVTGKAFGSTNMIVLDAEGEIIAETILNVSEPKDDTIYLYRGLNRQSLSCTPTCGPTIMIGDGSSFGAVKQQIEDRNQVISSDPSMRRN